MEERPSYMPDITSIKEAYKDDLKLYQMETRPKLKSSILTAIAVDIIYKHSASSDYNSLQKELLNVREVIKNELHLE